MQSTHLLVWKNKIIHQAGNMFDRVQNKTCWGHVQHFSSRCHCCYSHLLSQSKCRTCLSARRSANKIAAAPAILRSFCGPWLPTFLKSPGGFHHRTCETHECSHGHGGLPWTDAEGPAIKCRTARDIFLKEDQNVFAQGLKVDNKSIVQVQTSKMSNTTAQHEAWGWWGSKAFPTQSNAQHWPCRPKLLAPMPGSAGLPPPLSSRWAAPPWKFVHLRRLSLASMWQQRALRLMSILKASMLGQQKTSIAGLGINASVRRAKSGSTVNRSTWLPSASRTLLLQCSMQTSLNHPSTHRPLWALVLRKTCSSFLWCRCDSLNGGCEHLAVNSKWRNARLQQNRNAASEHIKFKVSRKERYTAPGFPFGEISEGIAKCVPMIELASPMTMSHQPVHCSTRDMQIQTQWAHVHLAELYHFNLEKFNT